MHQVASCPDSEQNVTQASKNLGCADDRYGNNQYICVPNVEKTALVEFCHNKTMGIVEKGEKLLLLAPYCSTNNPSAICFSFGSVVYLLFP